MFYNKFKIITALSFFSGWFYWFEFFFVDGLFLNTNRCKKLFNFYNGLKKKTTSEIIITNSILEIVFIVNGLFFNANNKLPKTSNSPDGLRRALNSRIKIKNTGFAALFLTLQYEQTINEITITQSLYYENIQTFFNPKFYESCVNFSNFF